MALRLQAEDYLTMPAITYNIIPVELPAASAGPTTRLSEDLVGETAGGQLLTAATAAAAVMKLRQIVNGWAYDAEGGSVHLHDAKVEALAELVEEQQGTPLLVAVAFLHEVPAIRAALKTVLPEGTQRAVPGRRRVAHGGRRHRCSHGTTASCRSCSPTRQRRARAEPAGRRARRAGSA